MHTGFSGPSSWRLGRRELLARLGQFSLGAAALSLLGGCPGGSYRGMPPKENSDGGAPPDGAPLRIGLDKVPAGQAVMFQRGKVKGYLHQTGGGDWIALSRRCTHSGCLISFQRDMQGYKCPCHGSTYDQEGRPLRGPAKRALTRYPTRVEGDAVLVDLDQVLLREERVTGAPAV